jgi:6,7-dimethyl-8-ribityllumazine synthase
MIGGGRFAIVRGTFYEELAARLTEGALRALAEEGIDRALVDLHDVPGAFELGLAAKACAETGRYRGIVCLGAVIRGETDHYDYVCQAAADGIQRAQLDTGVPCSFGVLTVESMEQALARSGGDKRDQGYNAARTVLQMRALLDRLETPAQIAPGRMT